jgi:C-terminal processing protease CtpA/Prc
MSGLAGLFLFFAFAVLPASRVLAADAGPQAVQQKILSLVPELGAATWKAREAAQAALAAVAAEHRDEFLQTGFRALATNEDPEVRYRLEEILKSIPPDHIRQGRRGFLGLSLSAMRGPVAVGDRTVVPIDIVSVLPNTVAQTNGLQVGDMVLQVDDLACGEDFGVPEFVSYISSKAPGESVSLVLLSQGKQMTRTIALGERPAMPQDTPGEETRQKLIDEWFRQNVRKAKERLSPAPRPASGP